MKQKLGGGMRHNGNNIRSDLIANKEDQPTVVKRAKQQRWGFYRPVDEPSSKKLLAGIEAAVPDLQNYLKSEKIQGIDFEPQPEFGVTFVQQRRVGQKMFQAVTQGFNMGRAIERLEQDFTDQDGTLLIPLAWHEIDWSRNPRNRRAGRRVIVGLAISKALEQLQEEANIIDETLFSLGMEDVVEDPNHLTLFSYKPPNGQDIKFEYKRELLGIVTDTFKTRKVGKVALMPLNIGPTYSEPCEMWQQRNGNGNGPTPELIK